MKTQARLQLSLACLVGFFTFNSSVASSTSVGQLRCAFLHTPLGLEETTPALSWRIVDDSRGVEQTAYHILVASSEELLAQNRGDLWDSGLVQSNQSHLVKYDGKSLTSRMRCFWKVKVHTRASNAPEPVSAWSDVSWWEMGLLDSSDWSESEWIGLAKDTRDSDFLTRLHHVKQESLSSHPSPLIRTEIAIDKPIRRARAYVSGIGYSEFYINGTKVSENVLDPGQTNYDKHTLYVTHDITSQLTTGTNALGFWLGNGFYGQNLAFDGKFGYGEPTVRAKLFVEFTDGTSEEFSTSTDWMTAASPILFDNVYWGETYDARLELPDWSKPGFDDSSWQQAVTKQAPCEVDRLRCQLIPPIRVQERLRPVDVIAIEDGKYIVDFGKNIAGWVSITVNQSAGDLIKVVTAEVLNKDQKSLNLKTMGGAPGSTHELWYVCKGDGEETWEPRFTYTGFQYVEISGLRYPPTKESIRACVVNSSIRRTGDFSCSESLLNQQYQASLLTLEGNWHSIPEDCPHREKCGWLGDAHAAADVSFYSYDMSRFYAKFMRDIEDSLRVNRRVRQVIEDGPGVPTMVAPGKRITRVANIDWAVAYVLLPWRAYLHTGDIDLFKHHFPHIKNFIAFYMSFKDKRGIIEDGLGDWCPPRWDRRKAPEYMECHPHVSGTAFFYEALQITGKMAHKLGDIEYGNWCLNQAAEIRNAFNNAFLEPIEGTDFKHYGSQTATIMAMRYGMTPNEQLEARLAALLYDINTLHDGHHSCGIHGLRHFYTILAEQGQAALAHKMLTDSTFPSPAYILSCGLSTWPERQFEWKKREFSNSLNHPMQAGFTAFMYETLGGIRPTFDDPGYKHFTLKPYLTEELRWVNASMQTPYGRIRSEWKSSPARFEWIVEIPANTKSTLYFPYNSSRQLREGGEILETSAAPLLAGKQAWLEHKVGSGTYHFTVDKYTNRD